MKIQIKNISYQVDAGANEPFWNYLNSGKWEPETFNILDHFISKEDIVIDIGAWTGSITLYAAHLAQKVYAIEPDPVIFPELENNIEANPALISKIKCCQFAFSDKNEKLILYAREKYGSSSSGILPRIRDRIFNAQVQGITLKKFIADEQIEKINFIKMDIEGGEFDLLPKMNEELEKMNFPTLYISFHYDHLMEHIFYLKRRSRRTARALMKLGKWFGIDLYREECRVIILKTFAALKNYKFIYTDQGKEMGHADLSADPFIIKRSNLVFTNKKWQKK